jgi:hypothetical protein
LIFVIQSRYLTMINFINAQRHKRLLSNQFSYLNRMIRRRVGQVLDAGTISIAVNAAIGSTANALAPRAVKFNCRFISTLSPPNITSATRYATCSPKVILR